MDPALILPLIVVLFIIVTILAGVKTVPQGQEWTVERLGRYTRTLRPGLSLLVPYIERVGRKLSVQETVLDIPSQEVITKDNATVAVDGVVFYQILDAAKAAYEVQDLTIALVNLSMTNIRSVIGSMDLDEVLSQRESINRRLLAVIDHATTPWGVKVTRIELRKIEPPNNLLQAMAKQMTAEREKRAEVLSAEGDRQAAILRAEGAKASAVLEAEGRRDAAMRDAEARERLAEAEAKATQMLSDAIAAGDARAVNYFVAQKYVEAFAKLAQSPSQKLVLLPMESSGMLASLAGIAEVAKDAFTGGGGGSTPGGGPSGPSGPWARPRPGSVPPVGQ